MDLQQLLDDARQAFDEGRYDEARASFLKLRPQCSPKDEAYEVLTRYLRHLGESATDPHFKLLRQIQDLSVGGDSTEQRLTLIDQALLQQLEFDLAGDSLPEVQQRLQAQLAREQEGQALRLLETAREEQDLLAAQAHCEEALRLPRLSESLRTELQQQLHSFQNAAQATDFFKAAQALLQQPERSPETYAEAMVLLADAVALGRSDAHHLLEEVEAKDQAISGLQKSLAAAREALDTDPWKTQTLCETLQAEAASLRLTGLQAEAEALLVAARQAQQQRVAQAQQAFEQGQRLNRNADTLAEAVAQFAAAADLNPQEQSFRDAFSDAQNALVDLESIETDQKQVAEAMAIRRAEALDFKLERARLEAARKKAGTRGWADLVTRLDVLREQLTALQDKQSEILTTIKLQQLPSAIRTPRDFDNYLQLAKGEAKAPEELLSNLKSIWRANATNLLRDHMRVLWQTWDITGEPDVVGQRAQSLLEEWEDFERREVGDYKPIIALEKRLELLRAFIADLRESASSLQQLEGLLQQAQQAVALPEPDYAQALQYYERLFREFRELRPSVRFIWGARADRPGDGKAEGRWQLARTDFAEAARHYANSQQSQLGEWHTRAQNAFNLGGDEHLQEAQAIIVKALPLAEKLEEYRRSHHAYLPVAYHEAWQATDWVPPFKELDKQVSKALTAATRMAEAETALKQNGDYQAAQSAWAEARALRPESIRVQRFGQLIEEFKAFMESLVGAEASGDVDTQDKCVTEMLKLLPDCTWASNYRQKHELNQKVRDRAEVRRKLEAAERALELEAPNFDAASVSINEALELAPEDKRALDLQRQIEEGVEGRKRVQKLRQEAEEAFGRGEFVTALLKIDEYERAPRTLDLALQTLKQLALRGKKLEEDAANVLRTNPAEAYSMLKQVTDLHGVKAVSEQHRRWLAEAEQLLAAGQALQTLEGDLQRAEGERDWVQVARFAKQILGKQERHVGADAARNKARTELRKALDTACQAGDKESLTGALPKLQSLEQHWPEEEETLKRRRAYDRASTLAEAREALKRAYLAEPALEKLRSQLEKYTEDAKGQSLYQEAEFRWLQARAIELEAVENFAEAAEHWRKAHTVRPDDALVQQRWLEARCRVALARADRLWKSADEAERQQAKDALQEQDIRDDHRVQARLKKMERFEAELQQVRTWLVGGDARLPKAHARLNSLLKEAPDFAPARNLQLSYLEDLEMRGRNAEQSEPDNPWRALTLYKLLAKLDPQRGEPLEKQMRERAERQYEEIKGSAMALETQPVDASLEDFAKTLRNLHNLQKNIQDYDPRDDRLGDIKARIVTLERYEVHLKAVQGFLAQARTKLESAQRDRNLYQPVRELLERAVAEPRDVFILRNEVRELRKSLEDQKQQHDRLIRDWGDYQTQLQLLQTETFSNVYTATGERHSLGVYGEALSKADLPAEGTVRNLATELATLLGEALKQCRTFKQEDPEDRFVLRNWSDKNKSDPLEIRQAELEKWLFQLGDVVRKRILETLLPSWNSAQELYTSAKNRGGPENWVVEKDGDDTVAAWTKLKEHCVAMLATLKTLQDFDLRSSLPVLRLLRDKALAFEPEVQKLKDTSENQEARYTEDIAHLKEKVDEAYALVDRGEWAEALKRYTELYKEFPKFKFALTQIEHCRGKIKAQREQRQWRLIIFGVLGVALLAILGLVFKPFAPPPVATPTPTQVSEFAMPATATPTATSTATPTPTPTVTPTPTPTATPRPTAAPKICQIYNAGSAWARNAPRPDTTGVRLLPRNTPLTVIDFVDGATGRWYQISEPVQGWVRAVEVTCP